MLKIRTLHPEILTALARAGHLATVLITDANYPHNTKPHPRAPIVWANFVPGIVDAVTILEMACDLIPVEKVEVMEPERSGPYAMQHDPPIWASYRRVLRERAGFGAELCALQKPQFNERVRSEDLCLVIATAERQAFANILLTIGVVADGSTT